MQRIAKTFTAIIAVVFMFGSVITVASILAGGDLSGQGSGGLWILTNATRAAVENRAREERLRIDTEARAEAERLKAQTSRAWQPVGFTANVALVMIALGTVGGCGLAVVVWSNLRAAEIRADSMGLFPIVRVKVGKSTVLHDPNRSLTASTVYTPADLADQVRVVPVLCEAGKTQTLMGLGVLAVQATAAAHLHAPILAGNTGLLGPGQDQPGNHDHTWPTHIPLANLMNGGASLDRVVLGATIGDNGQMQPVTGDMARLVHVAVGGSSGWGKSVFLRALVLQLALASERPSLVLADLEGATLAPFANCDRLMFPLADDERDVQAILHALEGEIDHRKQLFGSHPGLDSLAAYNQVASAPIPAVIAVMDEATALLGNRAIENSVRTLAMRSRKYGVWLILAGQDWKASSLDSAIKNQLSTRIQFKTLSSTQSRVLLEQGGAEALDIPGRALAMLPGQGMIRMQAPYVSLGEIEAALTGAGSPNRPMPELHQASDDQAVRIRELAALGKSQRQIEFELFGYTGGKAHQEVSRYYYDKPGATGLVAGDQ